MNLPENPSQSLVRLNPSLFAPTIQSAQTEGIPETDAETDVKAEKYLHERFIQWLNLNEVFYDHQNTHRRASNICGTPDFLCLRGGFGCLVEMKIGNNTLSEDQVRRKAEAERAGVPYAICYDLASAIAFCRKALNIQ